MKSWEDTRLKRMLDPERNDRDLKIIVTSDDGSSRPNREWECTMCGSWINWPGLPRIPCFHCNTRHGDVDGPLYVPRSKDGGTSEDG